MKRLITASLITLMSGAAMAQDMSFMLNDLKVNVSAKDRMEVQKFYRDVLGADVVTPEPQTFPRDYIQFTNEQRLNLIYFEDESQVPTADELEKGIWIKVRVDNFETLADKVKDSGVRIVNDKTDKGELYFQAPGGLIFRMVRNDT